MKFITFPMLTAAPTLDELRSAYVNAFATTLGEDYLSEDSAYELTDALDRHPATAGEMVGNLVAALAGLRLRLRVCNDISNRIGLRLDAPEVEIRPDLTRDLVALRDHVQYFESEAEQIGRQYLSEEIRAELAEAIATDPKRAGAMIDDLHDAFSNLQFQIQTLS